MPPTREETCLQGLSERQRRLVESNLALVRLTLQRHPELARPIGDRRESGELFQEGCLALVEAVRSHDPLRHGDFAVFAMARIHYAVSRFAQEHSELIRVPLITQRRRRQRRRTEAGDRHRPDAPPRIVRLNPTRMTPSRRQAVRLYAERLSRDGGVTIGDLIRDRYDRAVEQVMSRMKESRHAVEGQGRLLERCLRERWTVPDPESQTPIRQMARELGCSLGRITHCEERFRTRVAATIQADERYEKLLRIARGREAGLAHQLTPQELAGLGEEV